MTRYGKRQDKYQISVYLNEAQHKFIMNYVDKFGMSKTQIAQRLMFANSTDMDPRYFNR